MSNDPRLADIISRLQPFSGLSTVTAQRVVALSFREYLPKDTELLPARDVQRQSIYPLRGEVRVLYTDGSSQRVEGGSEGARRALGKGRGVATQIRTLTDVELVCFDDELLDVAATWDALGGASWAAADATSQARGPAGAATSTGVQIPRGLVGALPPQDIASLRHAADRLEARRGEVVVSQGELAGHCFVVEAGQFVAVRREPAGTGTLGEIHQGGGFGEAAMLNHAAADATVSAASDGTLLRWAREDLLGRLGAPLIRLDAAQAQARVAAGAAWLDVRQPQESCHSLRTGAISAPLRELRLGRVALDPRREYITCCASGRRSAVAALLLARRGLRVAALTGGAHRG
ncbi:MAG: cyclic nucleotide-binding domain-containing protein [Betaproteobacteria bacterium]|nr:cyclic nucleotide-binding domain-containing protein [Betaproteobacteria bacterium]